MQRHSIRNCLICLAAAVLLLAAGPVRAQSAPPASDYQANLAQYTQARGAYDAEASAYWDQVAEKRRIRNAKRRANEPAQIGDYVLTQPPLYSGPPRPVDPDAPGPPPSERPPVPVVADFLKAAAEQFAFVPDRPQSELEFKRAYAKAASAAGLTKDQIVGVYAFETGGNGTYDMQSGVSPTRPNAISPAIGYNQLLSTNTVSIVAEHGNQLTALLRQKAKTLNGEAKQAMERKIEGFRQMIALSRSVPQRWSHFDTLAKTTRSGWGIHAAILDRDLGPPMQVQKLLTSVKFALTKGFTKPLTAAELELMNLTGDGNGIDMVTMPQALRARVPTSNFFQQSGYERNPVARRTAMVAGLIADIEGKMRSASQSPGAKELAAAF
ncbi:MAG: hypothetical protein EXR03_08785 [Pseudolabrys sp.]|nr:hypothetical protein [Pseudolabrys sp.]MSP32897.1 hypothetical protein [Pseudolabrys sp.]